MLNDVQEATQGAFPQTGSEPTCLTPSLLRGRKHFLSYQDIVVAQKGTVAVHDTRMVP